MEAQRSRLRSLQIGASLATEAVVVMTDAAWCEVSGAYRGIGQVASRLDHPSSVETIARSPQKSKGWPNRLKLAHAFEKRLCLHALWGSQNPGERGFALILARKEFVPRSWSPSNFDALEYLCLKQRTKACRLHSSHRGATDN